MTPKTMRANSTTPIAISIAERTLMNLGSAGTPWLSLGAVKKVLVSP